MLESVLSQILQAESKEQLQAEPYEHIEERQGYRNGSCLHKLITRAGTLTFMIPRLRGGKFSTKMFARYQRNEQALIFGMMEMVINGVSIRKVTLITEELCSAQLSKSTVSELCKYLGPVVESWNHRPLNDTRFPFLVVDAMVVKVLRRFQSKGRGTAFSFRC